jgi:hypothetical protein
MFESIAVDRGLEARSGQTKDYTIGTCCFFVQHAAWREQVNIQRDYADVSFVLDQQA